MGGFSAVVTTGIYCRPGCSARPNPANVRHFDLAAAAEAAGFRACLRCRPYRTAEPLENVASEVVCRGIRLVVGGGARTDGEVAIAAQLGVSARHLRRLFQEQVGVTPVQLARSSRAHFARRLLDDTDLSVTDIAFASGFGSLRQFNRTVNEIFRATPRDLRARRRSADRLVADGGLPLRVTFAGPLDWDEMLGYLSTRAITGVENVAGGVYRRTILIDGDPGVIEVANGGSDHLVVTAHLPHWGGLIHVVEQVRRCSTSTSISTAPTRCSDAIPCSPVGSPHSRGSGCPGRGIPSRWVSGRSSVSRSPSPAPVRSSLGWSHATGHRSPVCGSSG